MKEAKSFELIPVFTKARTAVLEQELKKLQEFTTVLEFFADIELVEHKDVEGKTPSTSDGKTTVRTSDRAEKEEKEEEEDDEFAESFELGSVGVSRKGEAGVSGSVGVKSGASGASTSVPMTPMSPGEPGAPGSPGISVPLLVLGTPVV